MPLGSSSKPSAQHSNLNVTTVAKLCTLLSVLLDRDQAILSSEPLLFSRMPPEAKSADSRASSIVSVNSRLLRDCSPRYRVPS